MNTADYGPRAIGARALGIFKLPRRRYTAGHLLLLVLAGGWAAAIAVGVGLLHSYESTPGALGLTPTQWPVDSQIVRDPGHASLVMLVHPQCSCTQASLDELQAIMAKARGNLSAWVLFVKPGGMTDGWERTATWTQAQRIPGVTIRLDPQGTEAIRFGALTSGHVVLYDRGGTLLFSGGITAARGHAGDNLGSRSIVAQLGGNHLGIRDGVRHHWVFGCAL